LWRYTQALMHSSIAADRKLNVVWVEAGMLEAGPYTRPLLTST
jgi:hypothetical protein